MKQEIHNTKEKYGNSRPWAHTIPAVREWLKTHKKSKQGGSKGGANGGNPQNGDGSKSNKRNRRGKDKRNTSFKKVCASLEGISDAMNDGFGSLKSAVGGVDSKVDTVDKKTNTNTRDIKTLAGSVRDTLGVVGTLAGEVESIKKVKFAGSASAGSVSAQAQAAPDTAENRAVLNGALKRVNKFLDKQGGST